VTSWQRFLATLLTGRSRRNRPTQWPFVTYHISCFRGGSG
jgi:hypothetical protein